MLSHSIKPSSTKLTVNLPSLPALPLPPLPALSLPQPSSFNQSRLLNSVFPCNSSQQVSTTTKASIHIPANFPCRESSLSNPFQTPSQRILPASNCTVQRTPDANTAHSINSSYQNLLDTAVQNGLEPNSIASMYIWVS